MRGKIISYYTNKKRASTERIKKLADELLELDSLHSHSPSADIIKKRLSLQTEFDLLSTRHAEYLISKSKHNHYEHGEKSVLTNCATELPLKLSLKLTVNVV